MRSLFSGSIIPKSIRWRLPLSYAAIALFTTLALGLILLAALRSYYRQQELAYLTSNAQAIGSTLAPLLESDPPLEALQAQLRNFAFLSQTRLRFLDSDGQVLTDTGLPQSRQEVLALTVDVEVSVETDASGQIVTQTIAVPNSTEDFEPLIVLRRTKLDTAEADSLPGRGGANVILSHEAEPGTVIKESVTITGSNPADVEVMLARELGLARLPALISSLSTVDTPYGFGFSPNQVPVERRSPQTVRYPLYASSGDLIGTIELTDGPAYGDQVLTSVAWGWGIAGTIAVLLAAGVGWGVSRQISRPLLALNQATRQMAGGDLSIRTNLRRQDEVGQLGQTFNAMADQVEATVSTLQRFVADAAHEFHTPLTALNTNLELASGQRDAQVGDDFLAQAQDQVERLKQLTNNLLELSRLETATVHPEKTDLDLVGLIEHCSERYASQAEQAGLTYTLRLPDEAVFVRGNAKQLERVLDNLLENAIKFTPDGGAISVGLDRQTEAGQVILWIEDTGLGILPNDRAFLFERFFRGKNAGHLPGSGLGLAIVKAIVAQHQGQIAADQTATGSRFSIKLPDPN